MAATCIHERISPKDAMASRERTLNSLKQTDAVIEVRELVEDLGLAVDKLHAKPLVLYQRGSHFEMSFS